MGRLEAGESVGLLGGGGRRRLFVVGEGHGNSKGSEVVPKLAGEAQRFETEA